MSLASHEPDYEYDFDPDAENNTAARIYRMVRGGGPRVLDLGSGPGIVAGELASRDDKTVVCVDADATFLERARQRGVERTLEADLDDPSWVAELEGERFDVIVLADVLEHLEDPGAVLDAISKHGLLTDEGFLVVSIPNVAHEAVIASLIAGRFDYTPSGLLDATHIRFFTRETFQRMCEEHGFLVARLERTLRTIEQTELFERAESIAPGFRRQLLEDNLDSRTYQYVLRVEPADQAHQIADQRRRADQERRERIRATEDARAELRAIESRLEEMEEDISRREREAEEREQRIDDLERFTEGQRRTVEALEAELDSARAELDEVRREAEHAVEGRDREIRDLRQQYEEQYEARQQHYREVRRLQRKLESVYASETWRAGRALMWLPRRLKRSLRSDEDDEQESEHRRISVDPRYVLDLQLEEDRAGRRRYEEELGRDRFASGERRIVMGVSTADLDEGRGDLYTAIGLGLALRPHGYETLYLPYDRWDEVPAADVFVSLLAEPSKILDPSLVPAGCLLLGWIRNNTERWIAEGKLGLYDGLLCSSPATKREIEGVYSGPLGLLRIGVDLDLYRAPDEHERRGVAATINQWGGTRNTYATLAEMSIDFELGIFGTQRGLDPALTPFQQGPASFFELPSLYEQVGLVLDDQQDVNRPYGNVNSRIFESLAAGALPITDSRAGLDLLGLGSVPVYDGPDELSDQVRAFLDDDDRRHRLVDELRTVVLREHGYANRAERFDRFLVEEVRGGDRRSRPVTGVVAFQPDYTITNPYQDMLYSRLSERDLTTLPVSDPDEVLGNPRLGGRRVLYHLHWTATILGPATSRSDAERRCADYLRSLDRLVERGVPIVWTVHNARPHECAFPDVENELRRGIVARASAVHLMCGRTREILAPEIALPDERVHVVPHGSYVGVYPNMLDQAEARRRMGVPQDATVLLFLGQIRPYKGLERLLDAFSRARAEDPNLHLVVAGAPGRFRGVEELVARCEDADGVTTSIGEVPDEQLQIPVNACDVMVLPHLHVLNSGAALLAFTFGRPVIAPRTGCLQDQITPDVGRLFDPDGHDLSDVLRSSPEMRDPAMRRAAFERAQSYTYRDMAEDLGVMFSTLIEGV